MLDLIQFILQSLPTASQFSLTVQNNYHKVIQLTFTFHVLSKVLLNFHAKISI